MQLDYVSAKKIFVYDVTVRVYKIYMWSEKIGNIFLKSLGVACSEKVITLLVIRVAHALYIYHHTMIDSDSFLHSSSQFSFLCFEIQTKRNSRQTCQFLSCT